MDGHTTTADAFSPATASELARFVAENATGSKRPLFAVGGRTALHYGYPRHPGDVTIATSGLNQVIDYPARDMTITVEAGMRVEDLQRLLSDENQRLPVDVAQSHRATLGGAVATNTSGPGRFAHGTFRDYVIGITAVDGRGRLFSAGGRVVKNVAGYDLCKLLVGSMGTLAIITSLTLKLRPQPEQRASLWATFPSVEPIDAALERLSGSETRPTAIEVLNPGAVHQIQREAKVELPVDRYVLSLIFEGTAEQTDWQIRTARTEMTDQNPENIVTLAPDDTGKLWSALTEYQAASDDPLTFLICVPPSKAMGMMAAASEQGVAAQSHAGDGLVIGHLADRYSNVNAAGQVVTGLRRLATAAGGHLMVLACDDDWKSAISLFGERTPAVHLDRRVKTALDPDDLLSRGQFGL